MKKSPVLVLIFALALTLSLSAVADSLQFGPGTGTDPVVLGSNTSFTVLNNPGNVGSNIGTLLIFFSVPTKPDTELHRDVHAAGSQLQRCVHLCRK